MRLKGNGHPGSDNGAGYERRDLNYRFVFVAGVALVGLFVLALVASAGFERLARGPEPATRVTPIFASGAPEPRAEVTTPHALRATDRAELYRRQRVEEQKALQSYGWTSKEDGTVHIPIDRAMDILVERSRRATTTSAPAQR